MRKLLPLSLVLTACIGKSYTDPRVLPHGAAPAAEAAAPLKVHLRSGALIVLTTWEERPDGITGRGTRYAVDRTPDSIGPFTIPADSVALLAMDMQRTARPAGLSLMPVFGTLSAIVTAACVADPKSCFGSCPTFYVAGDDPDRPEAEGFSSSIARPLAARDRDALFHTRARGPSVTIRMRNEAFETHIVQRVRLLAVPRPPGGRILSTPDGVLRAAVGFAPPTTCQAPEGDCTDAVTAADGREWYGHADGRDLGAEEVVELAWDSAGTAPGLVLEARHSLLSTFLFYQTMAWLGTDAGAVLARLEQATPAEAERAMGMARLVGRLRVEVPDGAGWREIGVVAEAGPLASDVTVLPLPPGTRRARLRMTAGAWRLDRVALTSLGDTLEPESLPPDLVRRGDTLDGEALARLTDTARALITYPGDTYDLQFTLPGDARDFELFVESEGYYYEWMRSEWLTERDPALAALALTNPREALRQLAPAWASAEPHMEDLFWHSRFRRP